MNRSTKSRRLALVAATALATSSLGALLMPAPARADDCLLDTNNDGNADTNVDTDGGADSAGFDTRLACGFGAIGADPGTIAIGDNAIAGTGGFAGIFGDYAIAIGGDADGNGAGAQATDLYNIAIGADSGTGGTYSIAIGADSAAAGNGAVAVGFDASANGAAATALGRGTSAATGGTAVGQAASAAADAVAIGIFANAGSADAIAVGAGADATGAASIAIGRGAFATADNSVALGLDSIANEANTVSVGATGSERQIVNVASGDLTATSTDAVNGSQLFATNQNVAANSAAIAALGTTVDTHTTQITDLQASSGDQSAAIDTLETATATHTTQITAIQAVNTTQSSQISALQAVQDLFEGQIDTLFDLRSTDRRDLKQGVASAMAMASAPMPSGPGRIAYAVNGAMFRGEYAVGGSLTYRLPSDTPVAVNVGFSYAGNKNNGVRVGVAGEF